MITGMQRRLRDEYEVEVECEEYNENYNCLNYGLIEDINKINVYDDIWEMIDEFN